MIHEAAIYIKRNDKNTVSGKEHLGVKHNMIGDVIDNQDCIAWKDKTVEELFSEQMRSVYQIIQIDPKDVSRFRSYLTVVGDSTDIQNYRPRNKVFDAMKFGKLIGVPDLDNKMHSGDTLPILNGIDLTENYFKDSTLLSNDINHVDINAIDSGSCTIGVGGAAPNYLTWNAFFIDLINLTADLTATQVNHTVEGVTIQMSESLVGNTLSCTSNINLLGNDNNGWQTSINHNNQGFLFQQEGPGITNVSLLRIVRTIAGSSAVISYIVLSGVGNVFTLNIFNNLFDGNNLQGTFIRSADNTPIMIIYANMMYGINNNGIFLDAADGNASSVYESNSITGCTTSGIDIGNNVGTFRDNAVMGNSTDFSNIGNATGRNNADVDGTGADGNWSVGSGNRDSLTLIDEWKSTTASDGVNFLKPKFGGDLSLYGTTPTYATTLIDSFPWISEIGAKSKAATALMRRRHNIIKGRF